jgi:hypothetical protein
VVYSRIREFGGAEFLFLSQRDSSGLATHNNELKFRLQAMEQQAQLRDGEQRSELSFSHILAQKHHTKPPEQLRSDRRFCRYGLQLCWWSSFVAFGS